MSGFGAVRTASRGAGRRKIQTFVIAAVLAVSVASATLGLALLALSNSPFNHSFAAQRGADVTLTVNGGHASAAQLAATGHVAGVTAMAGPFPQVDVQEQFQGQPFGPMVLVGRGDAGGPVDDVSLSSGHWPAGPGQVVLDQAGNCNQCGGPGVGSKITVTTSGLHTRSTTLTVVGLATSITDTADAWVTRAQATALGSGGTAQLLYRFTSASTNAEINADVAALVKTLPAGTYEGAGNWLSAQAQSQSNGSVMEPFVVAFAVIGMAMAVLIVGNVVSGAVVAGYHRIGVLKSIGLTPAQVAVVYLRRIGWPALAGCVLGVVGGNLLALPVLGKESNAYGVAQQTVPVWVSVIAPCALLAVTLLAALGPAVRAGRLSATQAIAAGRAPRAGKGYAAHRLAARLRLPRPVGLGLAAPFARPARTLVSLAAIAFGATAVIFAFALSASLGRAASASQLSATAPVRIEMGGPGSGPGPNQGPSASQDAAVTRVLNAQPGTAHETARYGDQVEVPGVSGGAFATAFNGDSSWTGYALIAGHWYDSTGQIDVNTSFLNASGLSVGDTAEVNTGTAQVRVLIAGEVFHPSSQPEIFGSTQTLPGLASSDNLEDYLVGLRPGTNVASYIDGVNAALGDKSPWIAVTPQGGQFYQIATALIGLLALMVAIAAGLGVLNTVLMTTRDRVHDLGIYKALGMRPAQTITMVICWIVGPAILASAIAVPAAIVLNSATLRAMAGTAHTGIPASFTDVFSALRLILEPLAALGIAVLGALLPATWAARARPAVALRAE
jgi:putative ABC transport system permease protein